MGTSVGIIPAAGSGTRAYPYTTTIPKSLLEVDGRSLLQRNLELLRDQVGLSDILIVVGYRAETIQEIFGDGKGLGINLHYVHNRDVHLGLAHSMRLAGRELSSGVEKAIVVLADECYVGTDHGQLRELELGDACVACGVLPTNLPRQIRRNYSVELDGDRITRIEEKPERPPNNLLGTGTYCVHPRVFPWLEEQFQASQTPPDWMTFLNELIDRGQTVRAVPLAGEYINVNSRDDLNRANLIVRNRNFATKTVSLIVVAEEIKAALGNVMRRFGNRLDIDELVVVTRDAAPADGLLPSHARLRRVRVRADATFGDMVRLGMDEARGDVLITTDCDDSFSPDDLPKLLAYIRDADLVVGTRTTRQMVEQGVAIRGVVRVAHVGLAKVMEALWWNSGTRFSDTGCVFRAMWKTTWNLIRPQVMTDGQEVYPEMVAEVLRACRRVIEIPVNYYNCDPRHEKVTSPHQTVRTFFRLLGVIVERGLRGSVHYPAGKRKQRTWLKAPTKKRKDRGSA